MTSALSVVSAADATLSTRTTNASAEARPLLLVHGWGSSSSTWRHLDLTAFEAPVVTVDLRGHGSSTPGTEPATIVRMAEDLGVVLSRLDRGPATVVGHSMGAVIATRLAMERPELVHALAVIDPAYGADAAEMADAPRRLESYRTAGIRDPSAGIAGAFSSDAAPELIESALADLVRCDPRVLADAYESMYLAEDSFGAADAAVRFLGNRRVPTLAIYPSVERARTERAVAQRARAAVVIAPVRSHFLHEEEPEWTSGVLREWIRLRSLAA
ncbi:alpha/beta hydrolase [Microbacteriaceae bacterium VKM Ac-2855]|nr:alpha/beta hydrolase [Microbacteriaceae bacterium VKM Ac-2855]